MNPQIMDGSDTNSSTSTNPTELEEIEGADGNSDTPNQAFDAVLGNPVIVSEIIRHLDFTSLKQCRFVNKFWDAQVVIQLQSRAAIRFIAPQISRITRSRDEVLQCLESWALKFTEQAKVTKMLKIRNIALDLHSCKELQVTKDIGWLMDNFGDQFRYLRLAMELRNGRDAAVFYNILNRLRSLLEIELDLIFNMDCNKIKLPTPLKTVKSLNIRRTFHHRSDSRVSQDPPFIVKLLKVFSNVEEFEVGGHALKNLMTMLRSNSRNDAGFLPLFRHLKTLTFGLNGCGESSLTFLRGLATSQQLGLENLIISNLCYNQALLDALMGALTRHAPTLKSLQLMMNNFHIRIGSVFILPPFPKLEKLLIRNSLYFHQEYDWTHWNQVFYKNDFPVLEDLTVKLNNMRQDRQLQKSFQIVKNLFGAFVPLGTNADENTCVTMKKVEFSFPMDWNNEDNKTWGRQLLESFVNVFPNAILTSETLERVFKG